METTEQTFSVKRNNISLDVTWNTPRERKGVVGADYPTLSFDDWAQIDTFFGKYSEGDAKDESIAKNWFESTFDQKAKGACGGERDRAKAFGLFEAWLASVDKEQRGRDSSKAKCNALESLRGEQQALTKEVFELSMKLSSAPAKDKPAIAEALGKLQLRFQELCSKLV